ncbi:MAG: GerMN domain-containing protein [Spirochaetota bacterium]
MGQSSEKRRTSIGVLFWIAFILLVLVIFLANRSNIEQVLESTGIVDVVRDRFAEDPAQTDAQSERPAGDESPAPGDDPSGGAPAASRDREEPRVTVEPERDGDSGGGDTRVTGSESDTNAPASPATEPEDASPRAREQETNGQPVVAIEPVRPSAPAQREPSPDPEKPNRLMAGLYYIKVTDDGRTFPQRVVRPVYYASSPLTETIRTLIAGPSGDELDNGLLNLIPDGTELISAHISSGIAYLNFNQSFRFNPLGAEGTVAQLLQIIYSSTEFPTVERVQFLVDGEELDYLGGDGIYVGEPLGRDAFSS